MNDKPKYKKLAVIRGGDIRECPFGLPVAEACKHVGDAIKRMAPLEAVEKDQQEGVAKANKLVYVYHKTGHQCPFADKILDNYDKVDCDFGDTGQGEHSAGFQGSPLYPQTFQGIGLDGLYGYPLGFYADNNESRNLFFGLFSFLGKDQNVGQLIKIANKCDKDGDSETADRLDDILEDLDTTTDKEELEEKLKKLESMLEEYRQQYEDNRMDSGLLWELANKWFGPRAVNR